MKKILICIVVLLFITLPAYSSSQSYTNLFEEYISKNSTLSNLKETYFDLTDSYEEDLLNYQRMSAFIDDDRLIVSVMTNKNLGKLRLLWNIERRKEAYLSSYANTVINFRNTYKTLFDLKDMHQISIDLYDRAVKTYDLKNNSFEDGYVSYTELRQSEYDTEKALNDKLSRERNYFKQLRGFNLLLNKDIDTDYEYDIKEEISSFSGLEEYIGFALENSPEIKELERKIEENELIIKYISMYRTNYVYYDSNLTFSRAVIDLNKNKIMLEAKKASIVKGLERAYENLLLNLEEITLKEMDMDIKKMTMDKMKESFEKGYIEEEIYINASESYKASYSNYISSVYIFNTNVLNIEKDASWFMKGELER